MAVKFNGRDRDIIAYGKEPTECRSGGWVFGSHILTRADLGQQGFIQIVAECDRKKYSSSSGYINSYSSYSSGDHSACLSRSWTSKSYNTRDSGSRSGSYSNSSYSSDLSSSLETLTKSLVTCSCGSGVSSTLCSCSKSSRNSKSCSRNSSYDTLSYDSSY